jgi:hypothetical protein
MNLTSFEIITIGLTDFKMANMNILFLAILTHGRPELEDTVF